MGELIDRQIDELLGKLDLDFCLASPGSCAPERWRIGDVTDL